MGSLGFLLAMASWNEVFPAVDTSLGEYSSPAGWMELLDRPEDPKSWCLAPKSMVLGWWNVGATVSRWPGLWAHLSHKLEEKVDWRPGRFFVCVTIVWSSTSIWTVADFAFVALKSMVFLCIFDLLFQGIYRGKLHLVFLGKHSMMQRRCNS